MASSLPFSSMPSLSETPPPKQRSLEFAVGSGRFHLFIAIFASQHVRVAEGEGRTAPEADAAVAEPGRA